MNGIRVRTKKHSRLHLRLSPADMELIRAAAEKRDCSVSEFVRCAVLQMVGDAREEESIGSYLRNLLAWKP